MAVSGLCCSSCTMEGTWARRARPHLQMFDVIDVFDGAPGTGAGARVGRSKRKMRTPYGNGNASTGRQIKLAYK